MMKILYNAKIHTLNPQQPDASALVIDHHPANAGRVLAIGESQTMFEEFGLLAESEDMGGAVILPGLTDSHLHLHHYANSLKAIPLYGCSKQECLARVAAQARRLPPGTLIQGYGWSQNLWPEGFPNAADLDAVAPDHPAILYAVSLHVIWANHAALAAAGIDASTPDPHKGKIERNQHGQPTGLIFEEAMTLFRNALPPVTSPETLDTFRNVQQNLWQMGITGVHDFDRIPSFIILQTLHQRGDLKLRVLKNLPLESLDDIIASGLRSGFGDDMLRIGGIKAFADGALGSRTAAMLQPFEDSPHNTGMHLLDAEDMFEFGQQAVSNGLSLTIHAIGDSANHQMLDGYAQLRAYERQHNLPHLRHRIEHVQLLYPGDLPRLAELDLIASVQPIHATSDLQMVDTGWGERGKFAYAFRSLIEQGTHITFGSDAPVEHPNPFFGLHAAVTRRRADGSPGPDGWHPEQRLTLTQALQGFTRGPAYAAGMEDRLGMLAPGYLADLIVLDTDPFACPPDDLRTLKPRATMVGGDWVWQG